MPVSIQDIETTNILLRRAEEGKDHLELTRVEMAKTPGVDAVVSSLYEIERPIPEMLSYKTVHIPPLLQEPQSKQQKIQSSIRLP